MIKVGLVYGGKSPEYEFSLQSAESIIEHLDTSQFDIVPIHIDRQGCWILYDTTPLSITFPKLKINRLLRYRPDLLTCLPCDVILSVLHGHQGEDGVMQGLFDLWGIPYIGSGVLGSAIGMNKIISKQLIAYHQLTPTIPHLHFNHTQWNQNPQEYIKQINALGYPVFIKPIASGSSIGIHRVCQEDELPDAIRNTLMHQDHLMVEKALVAMQEIEIAVLENKEASQTPLLSAIGKVTPNSDFYSYQSKSLGEKGAIIEIPAQLSKTQKERIELLALNIFKALQLRDTARIDLFIDQQDAIYFNEVNTLPGLTKSSMYPRLWESAGKSFQEVITHLIELALSRY